MACALVSFNTLQDNQSVVTRITSAADVVFPFVLWARDRTPLLPPSPAVTPAALQKGADSLHADHRIP